MAGGDACKFLGRPLLFIINEVSGLQYGTTNNQLGMSVATDKALLVPYDHFDTLPESFLVK